jgi:cytochrome c oxidase cbb3-type subunit 3
MRHPHRSPASLPLARCSPRVGAFLLALGVGLFGCEREVRPYHELPAAADRQASVRVGQLQPGGEQPEALVRSPYHDNAWGMGEGKRLYGAYNCAPCHGVNGGGAIGPPLMDDKWIYGARADQIYATISQGRPNGMPSFGGHVPAQQIWQLVAYVEAMSGQANATSAPGRNDDQLGALPESRQPAQRPVQTGGK